MAGFCIDNVDPTDSAVRYFIITELRIFRLKKEELWNNRKEKIT
jgi:hypothetical protein